MTDTGKPIHGSKSGSKTQQIPKKPYNRRANLPPGAGPGRPKGLKDKLPRNLKDTILHTWKTLQDDPKRSLLALATKNPKWFYELTKGCFPKSIEFNVDINLEVMTRPELESQLRLLLAAIQGKPAVEVLELPAPSEEESEEGFT